MVGHRRLPREGEVAALLEERGLVLDAQEQWDSTWQVEPWLEMAATSPENASRIVRMIGADSFTLTTWRARFVPPGA